MTTFFDTAQVESEQTCPQRRSVDLVGLAWWHYWSGDYSAMCQCLHESLDAHNAGEGAGASVAAWVESFSQIAVSRRHSFIVDQFTDLSEWQSLIARVLTIGDGLELGAFGQVPFGQVPPSPWIHQRTKQGNRFVLYRTLGNDLPPRHSVGQTFENLKFILNYEPPLHYCQKKWIVNRIVDLEQERKILELLDSCHQDYIHLPFSEADYAKVSFDLESFSVPDFLRSKAFDKLDSNSKGWALDRPYRPKNIHTIGVNTVRNLALDQGQQLADWTLAFDGGCFFTHEAWEAVLNAAVEFSDLSVTGQAVCKHLIVPMARLTENQQLFDPDHLPPPIEEPQIIFHRESKERFDEDLQYGRLTKVEMFRRLQYPGMWDKWNYKPWERKRWRISPEAGQWKEAGWVARLASGHASDEDQTLRGLRIRTGLRQEAVWNLIDRIDERIFRQRFHPHELLFFNSDTLLQMRQRWQAREPIATKLVRSLLSSANDALKQPAYSVVQKGHMPPSGRINDYFSLSAFHWPDPAKADGLPYVYLDGQRTPENVLYSTASRQYDYTALQLTFDNTTLLALAWYFTGEARYAAHAAKCVRTWFLDPLTKMTPHLTYAQVVLGHHQNVGARWGLIETKDFYYFLDALRLLRQSAVWTDEDHEAMQGWCRVFLDWLIHSSQGKAENAASNNHATCYDLQKAALAGFIDDARTLFKTLEYSKMRIEQHIASDGQQPHELKRSATFHYCAFNLQNWANLAQIGERVGVDIANYRSKVRCADGCDSEQSAEDSAVTLERAFGWLLPYYDHPWPYQQIEEFNLTRLLPLYCMAQHHYCDRNFFEHRSLYSASSQSASSQSTSPLPTPGNILPVFHPYSGISPYWMFALEAIEIK
ncbi:MAG: alginate lyase family protein [Cyanobacteria bacterium J06634_5]